MKTIRTSIAAHLSRHSKPLGRHLKCLDSTLGLNLVRESAGVTTLALTLLLECEARTSLLGLGQIAILVGESAGVTTIALVLLEGETKTGGARLATSLGCMTESASVASVALSSLEGKAHTGSLLQWGRREVGEAVC